MRGKPKAVALCDDPRVLRALVSRTLGWCDLLEADDVGRAAHHLRTHDDASLIVTERLLQQPHGWAAMHDFRRRFPRSRRCLLATYTNLSVVVEAIHQGTVDTLVHVPLTRDQFLSAITGEVRAEALAA